MNWRDHKGRTALHLAIAFNNKVAVETMLHLGANPHVEDAFGLRPIDICYMESLRSLLEIKMASTKAPVAGQLLEDCDANPDGADMKSPVSEQLRKMPTQMNKSLMDSTQAAMKEDRQYPLDPKDIRQIPKEKVIAARIGADNDNYIMYAIKAKKIEVVKFLLREVPEIDLLSKNSAGMSVLHLAIRTNMTTLVKLLVVKNHKNTA